MIFYIITDTRIKIKPVPVTRSALVGRILLNLGLFVDHVLADPWIKFLDFEFVRVGTFVFAGGVVVSGTGAGNEFDFFTHCHDDISPWPD